MSQTTPHVLRIVTGLLTLCVATGSVAETPDPIAGIDAMIEAKTSALVEQALSEQLDAVRSRSDAKIARSIADRVDVRLAAATGDSVSTMLATKERKTDTRTHVVDADVRMQSGTIRLQQGVAKGHHRFDEPFGQTPKIAVGIRVGEDSTSARPPVALRVSNVDESGFDYVVRTHESAWSHDLTADWVAYASSAAGS